MIGEKTDHKIYSYVQNQIVFQKQVVFALVSGTDSSSLKWQSIMTVKIWVNFTPTTG